DQHAVARQQSRRLSETRGAGWPRDPDIRGRIVEDRAVLGAEAARLASDQEDLARREQDGALPFSGRGLTGYRGPAIGGRIVELGHGWELSALADGTDAAHDQDLPTGQEGRGVAGSRMEHGRGLLPAVGSRFVDLGGGHALQAVTAREATGDQDAAV